MALQKKTIGIIAIAVVVVLVVIGAVTVSANQHAQKQREAAQQAAKLAAEQEQEDAQSQLSIEPYGLSINYDATPGQLDYTIEGDDRFGVGVPYIEITNAAFKDTRDVCQDDDQPSDALIGRILVMSSLPTGEDEADLYLKNDDKYLVYQYPPDVTSDPNKCTGTHTEESESQRASLYNGFTELVDRVSGTPIN